MSNNRSAAKELAEKLESYGFDPEDCGIEDPSRNGEEPSAEEYSEQEEYDQEHQRDEGDDWEEQPFPPESEHAPPFSEQLAKEAESTVAPKTPYIEFLSPSEIKAYSPPPRTLLVGDNHIVRGERLCCGRMSRRREEPINRWVAEAGATQLDWFGLPVHCDFKTMIIQNENGRYRLKLEFAGLNEKLLDSYLKISPPPPFGLRFDKAEFRDAIKAGLEQWEPGVVIIDPWNAVARDDKAKDYRETFDLVRDCIPAGDTGPAIGISAHTRKPQQNERANGRALLNMLSGSYLLASVPRCVWILQHATDDVSESRVVVTCCKNNDGELGPRTVWNRGVGGLWTQVTDFDFESFDNPESSTSKEKGITEALIAHIFDHGHKALPKNEARDLLMALSGKKRSMCYSALDEDGKFGHHFHYNPKTKLVSWIP